MQQILMGDMGILSFLMKKHGKNIQIPLGQLFFCAENIVYITNHEWKGSAKLCKILVLAIPLQQLMMLLKFSNVQFGF